MAEKGREEKSTLVQVNVTFQGRQVVCQMEQELATFINSPDSDPETRNSILNMIFASDNERETPHTLQTENNNINIDDQKVHIWTESEEKLLISLRTDHDDDFNKNKNHDTLWSKIQKAMCESGIQVSKQQIMNKWKNLKKKFRDTTDANKKTGNEKISWKYEEEFNNLFGHRASTQASCTFDSGKKTGEKLVISEDKESIDSSAGHIESGTGKKEINQMKRPLPKKRSSESLSTMFGKIESMSKDMRNQMERHQREKMRRFDRLLDIFEKSVGKDTSDSGVKD